MRINPRQLEKMARSMGMKMDQVMAEEVIIRTPDKDIIIQNPQVSKVKMMGQETWQITGEETERSREPETTEDDIRMVMDQTGASEDDARAALKETSGDLAAAILKLKKD